MKKGLLKSIELIKSNPKNIFFIFLYDLLFILILTLVSSLINRHIPQNEIYSYFLSIPPLITISLFLMYMVTIAFIYSLAKLAIQKKVALFDNKKSDFALLRFFGLNLVIFMISSLVFIIFAGIFYAIFTDSFFKIIITIFIALYLTLYYVFINLNHSFFIRKSNIKISLTKSYMMTFKGLKKYYGALVWVLALAAVYLLLSFILSHINSNLFNIIYTLFSIILFYLVILINRVYFYLVSKNV